MLLISHRGNIDQVLSGKENTIEYIDQAIHLGYDVEVDIRLINGVLFLGHDNPDYEIDLQWLIDRKHKLWIHTKNFSALNYLINYDVRIFYHQKEDHTIINNCNVIWSHDLKEAGTKSIIPLLSKNDILNFTFLRQVYGICSDYVSMLQ